VENHLSILCEKLWIVKHLPTFSSGKPLDNPTDIVYQMTNITNIHGMITKGIEVDVHYRKHFMPSSDTCCPLWSGGPGAAFAV
jgi:hypothetical protein